MKVSKAGIFFIFLFLMMCSLGVKAQDFRYVYIQTEKQMPFYIRMGEQTLLSSSLGYIIIPRLTDPSYNIKMGFPQRALPELLFTVVFNEADKGYLLKTDSDEGVYMVDLQTKKSVSVERQWPVVKIRNTRKSNDPFAKILSEVMDDSTINEIPLFAMPEPALQQSQPVAVPEPSATAVEVALKTSTDEASKTNKGDVSVVSIADTINKPSYVTLAKTNKRAKKQTPIKNNKTETGNSIVVTTENDLVQSSAPGSTQSINVNTAVNQKNEIVFKKDSPIVTKQKLALPKNNCKKIATESDFLKVRKKMAVAQTEAEIQKAAAMQFGNACFTTQQVKELSTLFITEEGRYKFYVFAFSHVSDINNYPTLLSQLTNSYYITRFNAMIQR